MSTSGYRGGQSFTNRPQLRIFFRKPESLASLLLAALTIPFGTSSMAQGGDTPHPDAEISTTPKPAQTPARALSQVASASRSEEVIKDRSNPGGGVLHLDEKAVSSTDSEMAQAVDRAKKAIADCQAKYAKVKDYTCLFIKRERIDGQLTSQHEMYLKARATPLSFYLKFRRPHKGREAIYITGKHNGKVKVHDVGIGKILAGTMNLDPRGTMAMENSLHPITEAGIGALIETVAFHWNAELKSDEAVVKFRENLQIGSRLCTMIETTHPLKKPSFRFYRVRLYVDREHGLPIRFEGYNWPKTPGGEPELAEEYTYLDLKTNVGLTELDFDTANKAYSFGRF